MIDKKALHEPNHAIIRLHRDEGLDCLAVWSAEDVWVAVDAQVVWARFNARNLRLMQQALAMPAERFTLAGRWLIRDGSRVAASELPELDWQPIKDVIQFRLPWIGEAGRIANLQSMTWQLTRGGTESPIAGAILEWDTLKRWVDTAPQWRLDRLRYCISAVTGGSLTTSTTGGSLTMSATGGSLATSTTSYRALVLGTPVPPVESLYLVARQNVLIPAGMHWLPTFEPSFVERSFGLQAGQWLLWQTTDNWCLIDDALLVPLSRASLRTFDAGITAAHD